MDKSEVVTKDPVLTVATTKVLMYLEKATEIVDAHIGIEGNKRLMKEVMFVGVLEVAKMLQREQLERKKK